jgi:3-deoxy-D-manno-octulosonic-acid transferase
MIKKSLVFGGGSDRMKLSLGHRILLGNYALLWRVVRPFLRRHKRLKDDFTERVSPDWWRQCDLWIQAASGGESYLAANLLGELNERAVNSERTVRVLCTSCTRQGLEVLEKTRKKALKEWPGLEISVRVFPLDEPKIMRKAVAFASPKLVVLLEAELWPGLMTACAESGPPMIVVNGRMTDKSLAGYTVVESFWEAVAPKCVLAMSEDDASRFAELFGYDRVTVMPNMKFDAVPETLPPPNPSSKDAASPAARLLPAEGGVILLASVREEEEAMLLPVIAYLREQEPESVIVVAPRHMERVPVWRGHLPGAVMRSALSGEAVPGSIVVWDAFGELMGLYARADAVFVGGSLANLGGQNFLESAGCGKVPVIGPHWKNFVWVGEEFFSAGLGVRVENAEELGPMLIAALRHAPDAETVRKKLAEYIEIRRGGTKTAGEAVWNELQS